MALFDELAAERERQRLEAERLKPGRITTHSEWEMPIAAGLVALIAVLMLTRTLRKR